jgi:fatty acid synthase subunit alpha, fungi type
VVPKAFEFSRTVAAQIPTGWDAGRYGIPPDIVAQTDKVTLWALVCTAEALNMSGITDPYELYKHMHPSEVGTCIGSGMGGTESLAKMFKERREEKEVQSDVLQETLVVHFLSSITKNLMVLIISVLSIQRQVGSTYSCYLRVDP